MTETAVDVVPLIGDQVAPVLDALAELRIRVFREYPYLYDGDLDYETRYLERFAAAPEALIAAAFAGEQLVGAATALPLHHEHDAFKRPFEQHRIDPRTVFYLAESVLLPAYRGRGIGHAFFDAREAAARRLGYTTAAFCAVVRAADDPRRPADYRPLDPFWRKRGYRQAEGLTTSFAWQELGEGEESAKPMQFWLRQLEQR